MRDRRSTSTTPWRFLIHKKDRLPVRLSKRVRYWFWKRGTA